MPARSPVPCAVTIHDCTFFDHPEWHVRSKAAFFRRAIRHAARQAGVLICVSQVTADRLRAWCEVRAPVVVAPHGVDHERFTPTEPADGGGPCRARRRWACRPTGRWSPSSARSSRARAWRRWWPPSTSWPTSPPRRGAGAGRPDRLGDGRDRARPGRGPPRASGSCGPGYLPDAAVPALLRQAAVVAYPALEEGFGLPALEALACGAPLVTTEGTAMAEMAGGAALLVPPGRRRRRWPTRSARRSTRAARTSRRALGHRGGGGADVGGQRRAAPCSAYAVADGGLAVGFRGCAR